MRLLLDMGHVVLRGACAALLLAAAAPAAQANWLSRIGREAGETGTQAAKLGVGGLDRAAAHVKALPVRPRALHLLRMRRPKATGSSSTATARSSPPGRRPSCSAPCRRCCPGARGDSKLAIYLSEDTVFGDRAC